jgi:hypothetical protein
VADTVGVAVGELDRVGVARRNDDAAEVHQRDVKAEQCCFLTSVGCLRGGEAGVDLVGEFALRPESAQ